MRIARIVPVAVVASAAGWVVTTIALAEGEPTPAAVLEAREQGLPIDEELAKRGVVWHGNDLGAGERVLLVVGGAFPTREEAEQANGIIALGDVHGYYVASVDQFQGLREHLGEEDANFVLVSAFRTELGAGQFLDAARAYGAPGMLTPRVVNRGDEYVGLGQEPHPNGSGPLIGPLPGVST